MLNGQPLDEAKLEALRHVAEESVHPTLMVGTEVLEQMIDEIIDRRRCSEVMVATLEHNAGCVICDVCAERAGAALQVVRGEKEP